MLGTTTMIVLSSDEAVKDLLDRRSGNYSDRPNMFIGQTIASGGLRLVVMVCISELTVPRLIGSFADVYGYIALREVLAHDSQDDPQYLEHQSCCDLCSIPRLGEQDHASRAS